MSQREFADFADISGTALTYILTGQPPELSPWQIGEISRACVMRQVDGRRILREEYGAETLNAAYQEWRIEDRKEHAGEFRVRPALDPSSEESPFAQYIAATANTQQAFCKRLHVPASHVHRFASGKTLTMPAEIQLALRDVGFGNGWITELQARQDEWRLKDFAEVSDAG